MVQALYSNNTCTICNTIIVNILTCIGPRALANACFHCYTDLHSTWQHVQQYVRSYYKVNNSMYNNMYEVITKSITVLQKFVLFCCQSENWQGWLTTAKNSLLGTHKLVQEQEIERTICRHFVARKIFLVVDACCKHCWPKYLSYSLERCYSSKKGLTPNSKTKTAEMVF